MATKKRKLQRLFILLFLFICISPLFVFSKEAQKNQDNDPKKNSKKQVPLFKVTLDEEFNDSQLAFEEAKKFILENYYSPEITEEALYWASIKGMLRHISPPQNPEYSKLLTPDEADKFEESLSGKKISIGIKSKFNSKDGSLTVTEILPGSPAVGILQPFDRILRIDGKELKGKDVKKVDGMLQGEDGTSVRLKVIRDIKVFDVKITRREFKTPDLKVYILPNQIAVIEMRKFTDTMSEDLKKELQKIKDKKINKVIIDLRNNGGGKLMQSLKMVDLFLPPKSILLRVVNQSKEHQKVVSSDDNFFDMELAILVNKGTASSGEVFTGSLKDHKRAMVFGTKTYGKSVLERTFKLLNDYKIQFITGSMYTPIGQSWYLRGIQPDFEVNQDKNTYNVLSKLEPSKRLKNDTPGHRSSHRQQ